MDNVDILSSSSDRSEEDEIITNQIKIRSKAGRSAPLRKVNDGGHGDGLTVNLRAGESREDIDPEAAYRQKQLAAYEARKILEGDELPHREDDLRPRGIVEHEQEPLEIIVTEAEKSEAAADLLDNLIKREKDEDDTLYTPSPHAESHHYRFYGEIEKKLKNQNIKN